MLTIGLFQQLIALCLSVDDKRTANGATHRNLWKKTVNDSGCFIQKLTSNKRWFKRTKKIIMEKTSQSLIKFKNIKIIDVVNQYVKSIKILAEYQIRYWSSTESNRNKTDWIKNWHNIILLTCLCDGKDWQNVFWCITENRSGLTLSGDLHSWNCSTTVRKTEWNWRKKGTLEHIQLDGLQNGILMWMLVNKTYRAN